MNRTGTSVALSKASAILSLLGLTAMLVVGCGTKLGRLDANPAPAGPLLPGGQTGAPALPEAPGPAVTGLPELSKLGEPSRRLSLASYGFQTLVATEHLLAGNATDNPDDTVL